LAQNNEVIGLYLALSMNTWLKTGDNSLLPILAQIEKKYADKRVFQEAIVSSLDGKEEQYLNTQNPSEILKSNLTLALKNHQKKELNPIFVKEKNAVDNRTKGLQLFRTICATCHGADGKGIQDLAPPLKDSEYINGSMKRLASIILHGLSGPITVNGKQYQLNNEMPGLANNKDISDEDIADIIRFTQNAFAKEGKNILAADIKKLRDKKPTGAGLFNEKQLLETDFEK
jgi:mono/diheme cytochrome c family protein